MSVGMEVDFFSSFFFLYYLRLDNSWDVWNPLCYLIWNLYYLQNLCSLIFHSLYIKREPNSHPTLCGLRAKLSHSLPHPPALTPSETQYWVPFTGEPFTRTTCFLWYLQANCWENSIFFVGGKNQRWYKRKNAFSYNGNY